MTFQSAPAASGEILRGALWERLGFRDDPYYVTPLPVQEEALDLFVGRAADRERLRSFVAHAVSGRTMVQGPPGVGKTSLVNVVQQELVAAGCRFPLLEVVEVPADQSREAFLLTVLSGIVASLARVYPEKQLRSNTAYRQARQAVTTTLHAATDLSLSFALPGGAGAGLGGGRTPVPMTPLATTVPMVLELLRALVVSIKRRGFEGILVPVNNLDSLSLDEATAFLDAVRDITAPAATPDVHWIFIGGSHLFEALEHRRRRVSETFTNNPVTLGPLAWPDVVMALEHRRRYFALRPAARLPISERIAHLVYEAGGGELRFTMARLSRTVREFAARFPSEHEVPDAMAEALLADWGRTHLAEVRLSPREAQIVAAAANGGVRAKDYANFALKTSQRCSQLLRQLVAKGYLREGAPRAPYTLTPAAQLARAG